MVKYYVIKRGDEFLNLDGDFNKRADFNSVRLYRLKRDATADIYEDKLDDDATPERVVKIEIREVK